MLSNKDIEFLEKIKNKIVQNHKDCKGEGYIYNKDSDDVITCLCTKILSYIIDLRKSNIPQDYWELSLEKLNIKTTYKKEISNYIEKINNAIERGLGLFISCNTRGVGKTSLACEIAKAAIIKRYDVYYNLMQVIVSDKFTDNQEIIEKIKNSELVIIDEFDKVAMKKESSLSNQIENFLRELLPSGKTIILCSNMSLEEIEDKIEIESLITRYMKIIEMEGQDFSQTKNKNIDNLLDQEIDFFSETMIYNAKIHHKNKNIAYEKEYYKNYSMEG